MLCLKKVYRDEMLQLAILLSILRVDRNSNLGYDYDVPAIGIGIDDIHGWDHSHTLIRREIQVHPKNLDSILINYEQQLFDELNSLGRYNRINSLQPDVTAYLLNVDSGNASDDNSEQPEQSSIFNRTNEVPRASIDDDDASNASGSNYSDIVVKEEHEEEYAVDEGFFVFNTTEDVLLKEDLDLTQSSALDFNLDVDLKEEPLEGDDLTLEDMELIEVLWKQDVDMGFTMSSFQDLPKVEEVTAKPILDPDPKPGSSVTELLDEKLDDLDPWEGLSYTVDMETGEYVLKKDLDGTELSIDEPPSSLLQQPNFSLEEAFQLVRLNEDNFELPEAEDISSEVGEGAGAEKESETAASASSEQDLSSFNPEDPLDLLNDMIQTPQFHARPFQGRMPYVRTMSMEQRWQDLANLLSLPDPNHHPYHHFHAPSSYGGSSGNPHAAYHGMNSGDPSRSVLLHNATLAPPMGDLNSSAPYPSIGGASNLGSAVATSMNLTNSSEPMGSEHQGVNFKMENPHDMMYYQNGSSEMNHTTEGFLSSILNDEDLQLMDIAMNEGKGLYTMRPLDGAEGGGVGASSGPTSLHTGTTERGTDSDSAVSSMGSERVPSLSSDTEWMETNSDSGHTPADHYADYQGKFRWYDYNYSGRQHSVDVTSNLNGTSRMPLVAQKKHHMYGKRYFQEQGNPGQNNTNSLLLQGSCGPSASSVKFEFPGSSESNSFSPTTHDSISKSNSEMKYSCSVEFTRQQLQMGIRPPIEHVNHNHTYHLPPEQTGAMQRPVTRDKKGRRSEEEHLSRDEKRARSLSIPITVSDIINLPMDEFNERLSKYDLSESQLSLIRDIRRRGKNKVAAQNCRKRKLDQILSLADEVKQMKDRKLRLDREREFLVAERQRIKNKFSQLYRHIFQALRDSEGNPYSPYEWSLQQSADGSVILVPKSNATSMLDSTEPRPKHKDPDPRTQPRKP